MGARQTSAMPPSTEQSANGTIARYLLDGCAELRKLSELREEGWNNKECDKFFARQRKQSDDTHLDKTSVSAKRTAKFFYNMMQNIAGELHASTRALSVAKLEPGEPHFLDLSMAPGGFLSAAVKRNPRASTTAYSLPVEAGGHEVLLPKQENVKIEFLDITMLAADLGTDIIPEGHPDRSNFLPKKFSGGITFDVVLCDGQVLRTHQRAAYRELREARRLTTAQLALGLGHIKPCGTMVLLMHKVEKADAVEHLQTFHRFSTVRMFQPMKNHATRSSFDMVASNIKIEHPEAVKAIASWKHTWQVATFGSEEEYVRLVRRESS